MNVPRLLRAGLCAAAVGVLANTAACSSDSGDSAAAGTEDDLTSIAARSRTLEFVGTVYVDARADDHLISYFVHLQAQTAFGPMRSTEIMVNSRELKDIDPNTFVKRTVKVIDPSVPDDPGQDMLEIRYTYRDNAVVGVKYAERTVAPLALMGTSYEVQTKRILEECTKNDGHAREFIGSAAWYVFEPRLDTCQAAMSAEQKKIDADRALLKDQRNQVTKSEAERLYLPIEVKLGADKTNRGESYPEYAKLYSGGVQPGKLVVSLLFGEIDHDNKYGLENDSNWGELMTTLEEVMDSGGVLSQVPVAGQPDVDFAHFTLQSGKKVDKPSFRDLVGLYSGRTKLPLSRAEQPELEQQFAERMTRKWIGLERTVSVKIGDEPAHDVGIQFLIYAGARSDSLDPFHYATKYSDVFLYNGHSSIGFGPLDPRNFSESNFPKSYQLFWIDGCVTYNYYERDYIPMKEGGTKNLDLITNGIEAPAWRSGHAMGQWLTLLLNGKSASYMELLKAAEATEALRVVDGELDNEFTPAKFPITINPR